MLLMTQANPIATPTSSQTQSVGVVGPSDWLYMATVMQLYLENVADTKRVEELPPRGIYEAAIEFFDLVLSAVDTTSVPDNPPASISNYLIATTALRGSQPIKSTNIDVVTTLRQFADFVHRLAEQPHTTLSEAESQAARDVAAFFARIRSEGEAEAYEERVRFGTPPAVLAGGVPLSLR